MVQSLRALPPYRGILYNQSRTTSLNDTYSFTISLYNKTCLPPWWYDPDKMADLLSSFYQRECIHIPLTPTGGCLVFKVSMVTLLCMSVDSQYGKTNTENRTAAMSHYNHCSMHPSITSWTTSQQYISHCNISHCWTIDHIVPFLAKRQIFYNLCFVRCDECAIESVHNIQYAKHRYCKIASTPKREQHEIRPWRLVVYNTW